MSRTIIRIENVNNKTIKCKEDIIKKLPFPYNEDNSDISIIAAHSYGDVDISVKFGSGRGWDTLENDMREAIEEADLLEQKWNAYEKALNGDFDEDDIEEDEIGER